MSGVINALKTPDISNTDFLFVVVLYAHIIPQKNQNKNIFHCNREIFCEKYARENNNNKKETP